MKLKQNFLSIFLIPLLIFITAVSYYRFLVAADYMVSYEGECDPETATCYVDCVDDECSEEYYFTEVVRHHNDIYALCGADITDCPAADYCQPEEVECSVSYCDLETEAEFCETINEPGL